jgi:two-component system, response regulator PdtaR
MVAMDIAFQLEASGADVLGPFARVDEAIAAITSDRPHGAILDVNLLDGHVAHLAERLLQLNVPVIFCTGASLSADLSRRYPDAKFFLKPTSAEALTDALASCGTFDR